MTYGKTYVKIKVAYLRVYKRYEEKNIYDLLKIRKYYNKQVTKDTEEGDWIMSTINITNARKGLYSLVENVNKYHEPTLIVGKRANAVLISEDDWSAIQETLYLDAIPGMTKSILEGAKESIEDCISEDMVNW